jgi:hypothetical protein
LIEVAIEVADHSFVALEEVVHGVADLREAGWIR